MKCTDNLNANATHLFELTTYAFALIMTAHAIWVTPRIKRLDLEQTDLPLLDQWNRWRWLSTLVSGMVFGIIVEDQLINDPTSTYLYSLCSWVNVPAFSAKGSEPVPLWIGIGWGVLLYSTTWTTQRMKRPIYASAVIAALLAVNIDLSLDPIAAAFSVWKWTPDYRQTFFGVPFDNFICWFTIVFLYSGVVRLLFWLFDLLQPIAERWWRLFRPLTTLLIPPAVAALSLYLVKLVNSQLQTLYKDPLLNSDAPVFVVVFGVACLIAVLHARQAPSNLRPSWWVIALPITYHLLSWVLLFGTGRYHDPQVSALLIVIPFTAMVGLSAFGWTSRVGLATVLTPQVAPAPANTPARSKATPAPVPQT